MNQLENLIHNLETIAASTVDDFMNDDLLCASAARVAGEAAEVLQNYKNALDAGGRIELASILYNRKAEDRPSKTEKGKTGKCQETG